MPAGTNRVRFSSNFYTRVNHQDHRLWLRAPSVRVLAQWLELPRLYHCRRRVSLNHYSCLHSFCIISRGFIYRPRKRRQYCFQHRQNFVNTITYEPLHLAWWNFVWTCTLTTSRTLLNIKVISQRSRSHVFLCFLRACHCLVQLTWIHEMSFARWRHFITARGSNWG